MMISVGIIGAGKISSGFDDPKSSEILTHAKAVLSLDGFCLSGFYDSSQEVSKKAAEKWNVKNCKSLEELVYASDVLCCAVPDAFHVSVLHRILDFKSPRCVICEKPIATNLLEAEGILDEYGKQNIPIIVNYTRRFIKGIKRIKKFIERMGKLLVGNCYYGKGLIHNGSHMINLLDYLIGDIEYDDIHIIDVVDDYFSDDVSYEFYARDKMNTKLFFHVIPENIAATFQFELMFEKGKILYDSTYERVEVYEIGAWEKYPGYVRYCKTSEITTERSDAMINLYLSVEETIKWNAATVSSGESAVETLRKCEKIKSCAERN